MSREQKRLFWPTLLVVTALSAALVIVFSRNHAAATGDATGRFQQEIRVWIHGDEVRPRVLYASPGKASLISENETGTSVDLVVEHAQPELANGLTRVPAAAGKKRTTTELTLTPGEYVFYEARRPTVTGRIIVSPEYR